MEVLSNGFEIKKTSRMTPLFVSIAFHVMFAALVLFLPTFGKSKKIFLPVMDISMVDLPAGKNTAGVTTESSKPARPPEKQTQPEPETQAVSKPAANKDELVDMTKEEGDRIKKRGDNWTPKPAASSPEGGNYFPMQTKGSGKASGSMSVDAVYFPFMSYLNMLKNRIGELWMPMVETPVTGTPRRVVIAFKIDRGGNIVSSEIEEPSGDAALDRSALRAIQAVTQFPPLPKDYPDSTLGVHFGFVYEQ